MARGKRAKAAETKPAYAALTAALKFVAVAQKNEGAPHETHCMIARSGAIAANGVLAAGAWVEADVTANPHTLRLIAALERCGETFTLTQIDATNLAVQSEKFRAVIPCLDIGVMRPTQPDTACITVNDSLKDGFKVVSTIVADSSEYVVTASILLRANTMVSTNRHVMLEFWHGIDLPTLVVPKAAAMAVAKCDKPLVRIGFSSGSVTFWFHDGSWIKTQQYTEEWPNVDNILNIASDAWPIPATFYHGIDMIEPFALDNRVIFSKNKLRTHTDENAGATYEVDGIPEGPCLNVKYLQTIKPFVKTIDFIGNEGKTFFFGDKVRGVIMQMKF